MRTWVKLYVEILDDPKLAAMPDTIFRTLINLFAVAGRVDKNGQLGSSQDLSYWLRKDIETVETEMQALAKCNVCVTKNGVWRLKNWQKFNKVAASDSAKAIRERVKKSRENKRKSEIVENIGNTDVTRYEGVSNTPRIEENREEENREEKKEPSGAPAPAKAPEPKPEPLTAGQTQFLTALGAKQFKTHVQREAVLTLEKTYGSAKLAECAAWASKRGMNVGAAIVSIEKAIKHWGDPRPIPGTQVVKPFELTPLQIQQRDQLRAFKAAQKVENANNS